MVAATAGLLRSRAGYSGDPALPGVWCTVNSVAFAGRGRRRAAAIATAAALPPPAAMHHFDSHCHSFFHLICIYCRSPTYSRIVFERIDVVLAATHP
jgi:hypothetical protein